jgi:hypothetical protein
MYVAMRSDGPGERHIDVMVEHGFRAGTWEVAYDPAGGTWRVREPRGREHVLRGSEPWVGDLGRDLDDLMCRIARRAVGEALRQEGLTRRVAPAEVRAAKPVAA